MNTISQPANSNVTAPESGYKILPESKESKMKKHVDQKEILAARGTELTISTEGLDQLLKFYEDQIKSKEEEKDQYKDIGKLMEIARRIARGDKVPLKDEKKLMEYNSELYQMAKAAAVISKNKKRKEHDSVFDDEDHQRRDKIRRLNQENSEVKSPVKSVDTGENAVTESSDNTEVFAAD